MILQSFRLFGGRGLKWLLVGLLASIGIAFVELAVSLIIQLLIVSLGFLNTPPRIAGFSEVGCREAKGVLHEFDSKMRSSRLQLHTSRREKALQRDLCRCQRHVGDNLPMPASRVPGQEVETVGQKL